jgi:16S rRNA processing protein RimM
LEEDEFHVLDLVGLVVFDQATQTRIGVVVDVLSAGNDLLEVKLDRVVEPDLDQMPAEGRNRKAKGKPSQTVLIPFVKPIVPMVDLDLGRIEITPPEGLIEGG